MTRPGIVWLHQPALFPDARRMQSFGIFSSADGVSLRLMEWVWEPPAGEAAAYPTAKPSYSPSSYEMVMKQRSLYSMLNGAANETTATPAPRDMSECMEDAFITPGHGACADIHSCEDAVCDPSGLIGGGHYYNEPEIEALCGMCMMRYGGVFGCFAKHSQVCKPWLA